MSQPNEYNTQHVVMVMPMDQSRVDTIVGPFPNAEVATNWACMQNDELFYRVHPLDNPHEKR